LTRFPARVGPTAVLHDDEQHAERAAPVDGLHVRERRRTWRTTLATSAAGVRERRHGAMKKLVAGGVSYNEEWLAVVHR
jgi:hypothetical protein